jgi:hypothetical protein
MRIANRKKAGSRRFDRKGGGSHASGGRVEVGERAREWVGGSRWRPLDHRRATIAVGDRVKLYFQHGTSRQMPRSLAADIAYCTVRATNDGGSRLPQITGSVPVSEAREQSACQITTAIARLEATTMNSF